MDEEEPRVNEGGARKALFGFFLLRLRRWERSSGRRVLPRVLFGIGLIESDCVASRGYRCAVEGLHFSAAVVVVTRGGGSVLSCAATAQHGRVAVEGRRTLRVLHLVF